MKTKNNNISYSGKNFQELSKTEMKEICGGQISYYNSVNDENTTIDIFLV